MGEISAASVLCYSSGTPLYIYSPSFNVPTHAGFFLMHGSTYRTSVTLGRWTHRQNESRIKRRGEGSFMLASRGVGEWKKYNIVNRYKYNTKFVETNSIFLLINLDGKGSYHYALKLG